LAKYWCNLVNAWTSSDSLHDLSGSAKIALES
jgi:hypothetical protein